MAPVGSYESLQAAIASGADAVYFGVEGLNMRARSSVNFTLDDLHAIAAICRENGVKTYLTVNTILYDADLATCRAVIDAAAEAGLTAIIASDIAAITYARSRGVGKVITKINHISFGEILGKAGIECVVTPHMIAANFILRYVRAMQNAPGSRVEALSRIVGGRAEAVEFRANQDFAGIQLPLCKLRLKKDLLVACIIRDNRVIFPSGNDCIQPRDGVIVVTTRETLEGLNDILA